MNKVPQGTPRQLNAGQIKTGHDSSRQNNAKQYTIK